MMTNSGKTFAAVCAAASLGILALAASTEAQPKAAGQSNVMTKRVERGKYLVTIMVCNDCHTPYKMGPNGPEPDMTRMLSGHPEGMKLPSPPKPSGPWIATAVPNSAWAGPWGISYAINLTPDKNTGIGGGVWSEEVFVKAIKTGKHLGTSRPIQPPMPWPAYGQATDEDLKAIFAYLKSIPPIVNHVPDYEPPAPAAPQKAAPKK
jgi:hypothetical protein